MEAGSVHNRYRKFWKIVSSQKMGSSVIKRNVRICLLIRQTTGHKLNLNNKVIENQRKTASPGKVLGRLRRRPF